jgi:glutamine synthetase
MQQHTVMIEYIWQCSDGRVRGKTRVVNTNPTSVFDVPEWNYDGSSTGDVISGDNTEIKLKPVALFKDPFRMHISGYIALCVCINNNNQPIFGPSLNRAWCSQIMNKHSDVKPWFGIEQEYFFRNKKRYFVPLGPYDHVPTKTIIESHDDQPYYCRMGDENGRRIAERHIYACLDAGISISGMNAEVSVSQWEYQVGIVEGIAAADQLVVSRYLLERIAESAGVEVDFDPKPMLGCNGSGCHTNYSTSKTRGEVHNVNGLDEIYQHISKLEKMHKDAIALYGKGNDKRMTGANETANYHVFSSGVGTRHTSVRINEETYQLKKGYYEDRRPSSNMDPYLVLGSLVDCTEGNGEATKLKSVELMMLSDF